MGNAFTFNLGRRRYPHCSTTSGLCQPPSNASLLKWALHTTLYGFGPFQSVRVIFTACDHWAHCTEFAGKLWKLTAEPGLLLQLPNEQRLTMITAELLLIGEVQCYENRSPLITTTTKGLWKGVKDFLCTHYFGQTSGTRKKSTGKTLQTHPLPTFTRLFSSDRAQQVSGKMSIIYL